MTGFTFGGTDGAILASSEYGATFGTVTQLEAEQARLDSIVSRGFAFAPTDGAEGALWSGRGETGALFGLGPPSADDLLAATDGFALVVDPVPPPGQSPRQRLFTETGSEPEAAGALDAISMPLEANAISGARIQLAAEPDLYRLPLGDAVLGVDGRRLFSGRVEPVEASSGDESATLELLGPLSRLDSGGVEVSYGGMAVRDALRDFYASEVAPRTNNRVRGIVETPRFGEHEVHIPADDPLEASGTPKAVLDTLHAEGGLTYSVEHGARGDARIESFQPGASAPRDRAWVPNREGVTPKLDPGGYATDVVVEGARDEAQAQRYHGEASVSDAEARAVTGGERVTYRPQPDDELTSDQRCEQRAETLLAERRASYQMSGSVDAPPAPVQPGRVYRVPSMDKAAPDALTPVSLVLRKAEYSFGRGERAMTLAFESEQGIAGLLRRASGGGASAWAASTMSVGRSDDPATDVYPAQYPRQYPAESRGGYDHAYDQEYDS